MLRNSGARTTKKKVKGSRTTSNDIDNVFTKVQYPKDVQLLDELNKDNEEKYKKWLRKRLLADEILGERTLIIGVRGKDGIVLGGDRKVMRGSEADFDKKVRTIKTIGDAPVMFASAGAVGVIEDFVELFEKTLSRRIQEGKISSLLSVKMLAEDLVSKEVERYAPRLGRDPLQFLLGGLSDLKGGNARLYEIGFAGFGQIIKFSTSVGHGGPYARTIMKYLFPRNSKEGIIPLACQQIVGRVAACIYWIRGDIDDFVGGEPQILYMLDKGRRIKDGKYNRARILRKVNEIKDILRGFETEKAGKQRVTKKAPDKN